MIWIIPVTGGLRLDGKSPSPISCVQSRPFAPMQPQAGHSHRPAGGFARADDSLQPINLQFGTHHPRNDALWAEEISDWRNNARLTLVLTAYSGTQTPRSWTFCATSSFFPSCSCIMTSIGALDAVFLNLELSQSGIGCSHSAIARRKPSCLSHRLASRRGSRRK